MASRAVKSSRTVSGVDVAVYGYKDTMKALKSIAPDVAKQFDREIRDTIKPVAMSAKAKVPANPMGFRSKGNWDNRGPGVWSDRLGWNQSKVRTGIRVQKGGKGRRNSGISVAWKVSNTNAAGAIFEIAGRKSAGSTAAGRAFRSNLSAKGGRPSRLIWQAWDDMGGDATITPKVVEIMDRASATVQQLLNTASDKG